jgi:tRNA modification GTPase
MDRLEDTIAAIATPYGEGGIGIIRVSGEQTRNIIQQVFITSKGNRLKDHISHKLYYGYIVDPRSKARIDEVMLAFMRKPRSYTREDSAEIFCHGGLIVLKTVLQQILASGARLAKPGEFTRRAFLNGRIDLAQAEAVNDIIKAQNDASLKIALGILEGRLSKEIKGIQKALIDILAQIEASLDFAEEDLDLVPREELVKQIENILDKVAPIIESYEKGKGLREGINLVITGRPNVGKSTLMNCLLEQDRAIVTPIPGTTRDVITEEIEIKGIPIKVRDTAGLVDNTNDLAEAEGVRRTKNEIERADIVLLVLDGSLPTDGQEQDFLPLIADKECLIVINKIDLPQILQEEDLSPFFYPDNIIRISAKEGYGVEKLRERIEEIIHRKKAIAWEGPILTKLRHKEALVKVQNNLLTVKKNLDLGLPEEICSIDLREAITALGEITGESYTVDILDKIFSEFCIGK